MPDGESLSEAPSLRGRVLGHLAASTMVASTLAAGVMLLPTAAHADVVHNSCQAVYAGGSSGWCGLYPGNATDNVQELGQVTLSSDGTSIVVATESASSGTVPATSFACVLSTPASEITHRLQGTQCAKAGGVWFPASGGTISIDLTQYPQFLNSSFTVQVAANQSANSSNGDSFYNNVTVTSTAAGGGGGGGINA